MCQKCGEKKCCCVKTVSVTGKRGERGKDGKDGKDTSSLELIFRPTPAQVKTANSIPVVMLPAPGVGKAIVVESATIRRKFVTAGYTSVGALITSQPTSAGQFGTTGTFLSVAASSFPSFTSIIVNMLALNNLVLNVYENAPLYFEVGTADSAVGDDEITVYIKYKIIKLF